MTAVAKGVAGLRLTVDAVTDLRQHDDGTAVGGTGDHLDAVQVRFAALRFG